LSDDCDLNNPLNCAPTSYDWTWDWNSLEEVIELYGENSNNPDPTVDQCFRISGYHSQQDDWQNSPMYCDTSMQVTVMTAQPRMVIDTLGCGSYCLDMDETYDKFREGFGSWPQPIPARTSIEFVDCDDGSFIAPGECLFFDGYRDDICVNVSYEFPDGAWYDNGVSTHPVASQTASCTVTYGPYKWGIEEIDASCETGVDFVSFDWNDIAGVTGYDLISTSSTFGSESISNHPSSEFVITGLTENEEVTLEITAFSNFTNCTTTSTITCLAQECVEFPPLSFQPCEEIPGTIIFSWDAISGIDSFLIYDEVGQLLAQHADLEWIVTGLSPTESSTIYVEPIHPKLGCSIAPAQITCTAPCPDVPMMSPIVCLDWGSDFVTFGWEEVPGVLAYEVTSSINNGPFSIDTVMRTNTEELISLSMLQPGDQVDVSVVAINAEVNCGNGVPQPATCFGLVASHDIGGFNLTIFPNPVEEFLKIDTELKGLNYKVIAIDGRLIKSGTIERQHIDLTTIEAGTYLLIIESLIFEQQIVERIVKV